MIREGPEILGCALKTKISRTTSLHIITFLCKTLVFQNISLKITYVSIISQQS